MRSQPSHTPAREGKRGPRVPLLIGLLIALSAAALVVWREPLELHQARRGAPADLEAFVARHPDSIPGVRALAEEYLRRGRPADTTRLLQARIEAQPANPDFHVLAARAAVGVGDSARALAHVDVLQRLEPNNPRLTTLRALASLARGDTAEAEGPLRSASETDPPDPQALAGLAEIAAGEGRLTQAEALYSRAAALSGSVPTLARLAEVRYRLGRPEAAVAAARRALKLAPDHRAANLWLGRALYALDPEAHAGEAEAALRRALAGPGDAPIPRYHLAQLLRERGRVSEAAALLEANVAANEMDKASLAELLLCYRMLGKKGESARVLARLERVNRLDLVGSEMEYRVWAEPENLALRLKLAQTYVDHGRGDLAIPELKAILDRDPTHAEARILLRTLESGKHP